MKLHSAGSLLGPTDRERGNLSGGEVESHFFTIGDTPTAISWTQGELVICICIFSTQ